MLLTLEVIELIVTACLLSLLGGFGSYLQGCRAGRFERSWLNALTEMVLALTVGLLVMYAGVWQEWPPALTCVLILVLSNNGGDSLHLAKGWVSQSVTRIFKTNNLGNNNE